MADRKPTPAPAPPEVDVVKTTKTEDGLRWHYAEENGQVRTWVHTKDGRTLNVLLASRDAGRAHLRAFLADE